MTAKRFIQLFICYAVSIVLAITFTNMLHLTNQVLYLLVASIIGYIVITIPLTLLTIFKKK